MNKKLLRQLVSERIRMEAGLITPARVTDITRDKDGKLVRREIDPKEWQRAQAAKQAARITLARDKLKLTQDEFSVMLGVSRRTLENWEQGRRVPTGAARVLLAVAEKHPKMVLEAVA